MLSEPSLESLEFLEIIKRLKFYNSIQLWSEAWLEVLHLHLRWRYFMTQDDITRALFSTSCPFFPLDQFFLHVYLFLRKYSS